MSTHHAALIAICSMVHNVEGDAAEVGVFQGGTLRIIAETLPGRTLFGFDTFEGLPREKKSVIDDEIPGRFSETSLARCRAHLKPYQPQLVKGTFPKSASPFSKKRFCFAHFDGDFYLSAKEFLDWFYPRLNPNGILAFHDYSFHGCKGVERAVGEFLISHPERLCISREDPYVAWFRKSA